MQTLFFVDYLTGRKSGYYWPSLPPKKNDENKKTMIDYMNVMTEELFRQTIRQKWESR